MERFVRGYAHSAFGGKCFLSIFRMRPVLSFKWLYTVNGFCFVSLFSQSCCAQRINPQFEFQGMYGALIWVLVGLHDNLSTIRPRRFVVVPFRTSL